MDNGVEAWLSSQLEFWPDGDAPFDAALAQQLAQQQQNIQQQHQRNHPQAFQQQQALGHPHHGAAGRPAQAAALGPTPGLPSIGVSNLVDAYTVIPLSLWADNQRAKRTNGGQLTQQHQDRVMRIFTNGP
jgi:hypothetical protein